MIKKRKSKKQRKNPKYVDDTLIDELAYAFVDNIFGYFASAITYYNQGKICKDCGEDYVECECEKCIDCTYNRCMCDLEFSDLQHEIWKFSKEKLNDEQLLKLTHLIYNRINEIQDYNYTAISLKIYIRFNTFFDDTNHTKSDQQKLIKELRNIE